MALCFMCSLVLALIYRIVNASETEYSNLARIDSLSQDHDYGNTSRFGKTDDIYKLCIEDAVEEAKGDFIFGPFYKFVIELSRVSLPCSPCRYSDLRPVTWTKLTFENKFIPLTSESDEVYNYTIETDNTLILKSVQASDFGTYYCSIGEAIGYIWSLEVERFDDFDVIKWRHAATTAHDQSDSELKITTKWERWSECNKCDRTGKRHRIGYCFVEKPSELTYSSYSALQTYRNGLSCNLFLDIHPEVEPETIQALAIRPKIAIGYCKISCDYFAIDPSVIFSKAHPKLQGIYDEHIEMKAEEEYQRRINDNPYWKYFPGKPTKFEAVVLVMFFLLQLYIIIHVCKNRKKAH